jgi:hypothetical protein
VLQQIITTAVLALGVAVLWAFMNQPNPSPAPSPPPPPPFPNLPCGFDFTADRTLRKGAIENEWCYNNGIPISLVYDPVSAAECESFFIDPLVEPETPVSYAFDCSAGCRPCAYLQGNNGKYRCKNQPC